MLGALLSWIARGPTCARPKLLVTKETAKQIRDHTLDTFEELTAIHNHPVAQLLQTAQQYDESNSWPRSCWCCSGVLGVNCAQATELKRAGE